MKYGVNTLQVVGEFPGMLSSYSFKTYFFKVASKSSSIDNLISSGTKQQVNLLLLLLQCKRYHVLVLKCYKGMVVLLLYIIQVIMEFYFSWPLLGLQKLLPWYHMLREFLALGFNRNRYYWDPIHSLTELPHKVCNIIFQCKLE